MVHKKLLFPMLLAVAGSIHGLNPLHDASYSLLPRRNISQGFLLSGGVYLYPQEDLDVAIPVSAGFGFNRNLEMGFGLKTLWGNSNENFQHGVIGLRYNARGGFVLQSDLLFGMENQSSGISIGFLKRRGFNKSFFSWFTGRLGFLDGLTGENALMSMEVAYYPTLKLVSSLFLEMGIIASSQTNSFEDYLAIDLQPGFRIPLRRRLLFNVTATLGLAGDRKEEARINTILYKRFR